MTRDSHASRRDVLKTGVGLAAFALGTRPARAAREMSAREK
jgi:uncharacterized protein (DUF1501 family)